MSFVHFSTTGFFLSRFLRDGGFGVMSIDGVTHFLRDASHGWVALEREGLGRISRGPFECGTVDDAVTALVHSPSYRRFHSRFDLKYLGNFISVGVTMGCVRDCERGARAAIESIKGLDFCILRLLIIEQEMSLISYCSLRGAVSV